MKKQIIKQSLSKKYAPNLYYQIYRSLSLPFTYVFLKLKISPNFITFLSLLFAIASVPLYLFLHPLAIVFFNLSIIMDYSDGVVARLSKKTSKIGAFFDCMIDKTSFYLLTISITLGLFILYDRLIILLLGGLLLITREFKLYSSFFLHKIFSYNIQNIRKNGLMFRLVDLFYIFFPFIILFNYTTILLYYLLFIIIELIKMLFEMYPVLVKSTENKL